MKRIFLLAVGLVAATMLPAQSRYVEIEGVVDNGSGVTYNRPQSTLAVDLVVEREAVTAGPYARYALKCLGLKAPFSDKVFYTLKSASVALADERGYDAPALAAPVSEPGSYLGDDTQFAALQVDRTEMLQLSTEQAAVQAANRIFQLRRSRLELITGEAGENVFGAGLKNALEAIDAQEQALLELFLGKCVVTTETRRILLTPASDKRQYILCRFSEAGGILPSADLSGEIVSLEITPGQPFAVEESVGKSGETLTCRVAAPSVCTVQTGGRVLTSATLPLFEFGRSVKVPAPRRK